MQGYAGCRGGLHCCTSEKVASTGGCAKGSLRGLFCTARGGRLWKKATRKAYPHICNEQIIICRAEFLVQTPSCEENAAQNVGKFLKLGTPPEEQWFPGSKITNWMRTWVPSQCRNQVSF